MIVFELVRRPRAAGRPKRRRTAHEPGRTGGQSNGSSASRCRCDRRSPTCPSIYAAFMASTLGSRRSISFGQVSWSATRRMCTAPMGGPAQPRFADAVNLGWKLAAVLNGQVDPALLATYEAERRPAAERVIMHSRAQLALVRPGPEVTALRELFSELVTEPSIVRRLVDLVSGRKIGTSGPGCPSASACRALGARFAVANGEETRRIAELARDRAAAACRSHRGRSGGGGGGRRLADRLAVAVGRPVGDVAATALLGASGWLCGLGNLRIPVR